MTFGLPHWIVMTIVVLAIFYVGRKTTIGSGLFAPITG